MESEKRKTRKRKLEKWTNVSVGILMCLCGAFMCAVAILNGAEKDKGSIIPSLVIAALSLISNSFFFVRYTILYRSGGNVILKTQSRLYRAKCLVDGCVSVVLTVLMVSPHSTLAHGMDMIGSFAVATTYSSSRSAERYTTSLVTTPFLTTR